MSCMLFSQTQSLHVTDCMTVTSLSASLRQKVSAAMDHLFQICVKLKIIV